METRSPTLHLISSLKPSSNASTCEKQFPQQPIPLQDQHTLHQIQSNKKGDAKKISQHLLRMRENYTLVF